MLSATRPLASSASLYGGLRDDQVPRFLVPRLSTPPTVDGRIDAAEWREATAISGVALHQNNELHPRPTTFYLGWDDDNLYLAARVWVMPDFQPSVGGREPGRAETMDSGLELVLTPRGQNRPPGQPDMGYKFNLNVLGYVGMLEKVAVGQMIRNWQPQFRIATHMTEPGSAPNGGRWWQLEAAMSFADFELTGPHRAGDEWGMLLCAKGWSGVWSWDRIPGNSDFFMPRGHSVGILADGIPGVQVTKEQFPGPCDGRAFAQFSVYNPTANPVEVDIAADYHALRRTDEGEKPEPLVEARTKLIVAPGQSESYTVDQPLSVELDQERGSISYRVSTNGRDLLSYFTFFRTTYPDAYLQTQPRKELFPMQAAFDPIGATLRIRCDSYYLENRQVVEGFTYRVKAGHDERVIAEGVLTEPRNYYFGEIIDLPILEPGQYNVEATMLTVGGVAAGMESIAFDRKNEAVEFADWWMNDIGAIERVIPPFAAMQRHRNTVSMWGREYEIDGLGLPRRIRSNDGEVMAAPARIVATIDGREHVVGVSSSPRFHETKDWHVSFTGRASGAGLRFTSRGWIEQDGMCRIELDYEPAGRGPVAIEALRIEYPLAAANAQGIYCIGPGNNFAARTIRMLQPEQGLLWSTLETGRPGSLMLVGSFYPSVWVGDDLRGLSWWADNDQGWVPDNDVPAHQIERRGDEVVLVNNIIGKPVTLDESRTIVFSYTATPFRPLPKGWRSTIISENGTFKGPHKGRTNPQTGETVDTWWALHPPSRDPAEWGELWAEYKEKADAYVAKHQSSDPARARSYTNSYAHTSIPIVGYPASMTRDGQPDRYFAASWQGSDFGDRYRNFSRSHSDFLLYLIRRAIVEGGIRTFYWDLFSPSPAASEQAEMGYRLPDGRMQPGYFGFNLRRFSMRLFSLCEELGLNPGAVVVHCTNALFLPANPWVDAILDGEEHQITEGADFDWVDGWSFERMRVLSVPHTFGNVVSWMQIIYAGGKRGFDLKNQQVEYIRLFDAWSRTFNRGRMVPMPIIEWGINDERVEFIPFWNNSWATCDDPDLLISLWRLPDRVMLAVFNMHREETKDAAIQIDLAGLELLPELPWQEFILASSLDNMPSYHRSYWESYSIRDQDGKHVRVIDQLEYDKIDSPWRHDPKLDIENARLTVPGVIPRRGRFISIRRY